MAKRRDPARREYNPLDDARGRLPIDEALVREVILESDAASTLGVKAATAPALKPAAVRPLAIERLTKYNKFLTTHTEKLELERLAARLSGALGVSVRSSHLIRACLIHLLHAESEIIRRAERQPSPRRPSNTEAVALAEFDHMIAEILSHAFRAAGPVRRRREE